MYRESKIMAILRIVADAMIISLMWFGTSLGIITIGASTTSAYYVLIRRISDRESSIITDYFASFKANFKVSTIAFLSITGLLAISLNNLILNPATENIGLVIYILQIIIIIELVFISIHIYPILSRFDLKPKELVKTTLIIANKHLFITITHGALITSLFYLCINAPFLIAFAFGFYCLISSYMLIKVYRKYIPDMDKNTDIDS